ncbi:IS110 family transposase [Streptomyces sp. JV184]|uniref:IS110 family transposase n=1 Tax=Streptomyces sp. JV184 TaxID=858637 RepID=UPI003FA7D8B9
MPETWVGTDAGKADHHCMAIDAEGRRLLYVPGRTVHHASGSYRGDGKTDGKHAFVIADQDRVRRDLYSMHAGVEGVADTAVQAAEAQRTVVRGMKPTVDLVTKLARRPLNALWALIRDNRITASPPTPEAAAA